MQCVLRRSAGTARPDGNRSSVQASVGCAALSEICHERLSMFLSRLFPFGRRPGTPKYRIAMARELHGQAIRYVTERNGDNDDVIGRGGSLTFRDGELLVFSSGEILLRADADKTDAGYLLSGDGVVITAPDKEQGRYRTVIAHFVYHRK